MIINLQARMQTVLHWFQHKKPCAILHLAAVICLVLPLKLAAASSQTDGTYDPCRLNWTRLLFNGEKFLGNVSVEVEMAFVSPQEAKRALIASPRGTPAPLDSSSVGRLTVYRTVNSTFRSQITEVDTVWFNAARASTLGRVRTRRGEDDFLKIYRFTDLGVFRIQKEPANNDELKLTPDQWTDVGQNFYAHDLKQLGCAIVSERSLLLYLASVGAFSDNAAPISVCIFGKRQLHKVQLSRAGVELLTVNYVEKGGSADVVRDSSVEALKIVLEVQPLKSSLDEIENFSLLGLHKDITIFIDPISHMPVQVSGKLPRLGMMHFKLREVRLQQKAD